MKNISYWTEDRKIIKVPVVFSLYILVSFFIMVPVHPGLTLGHLFEPITWILLAIPVIVATMGYFLLDVFRGKI